ncbi:MAG TPA: GNAT family N-acetyltransferase [Oscillatoriaceae cyanobacterium]
MFELLFKLFRPAIGVANGVIADLLFRDETPRLSRLQWAQLRRWRDGQLRKAGVVTSRAKSPKGITAEMLMRVKVRLAEPEDAEGLCEANVRSIREVCGADPAYTPEQIDRWCEYKTPAWYRELMTMAHKRLYAGLLDGAIAGVGLLDLKLGKIELLYLAPEALGAGLGRALLKRMEHEAREHQLTALTLQSTTVAREFYERQGYQNLGPGEGLPSFSMRKGL